MGQPDQIVLSVDEQNDGVGPVDVTFGRFDSFPTRSTYVSEDHTVAERDTLTFYRTPPKQNGNFKGTTKVSIKFTQDVVVPGVDGTSSITAPMIGETSYSLPVGVTPEQVLAFRQRQVAIVDRDDIMDPLCNQMMI